MKWISVKDRLPEHSATVLVYCGIYGRFVTTYTPIDGTECGQWYGHDGHPGGLPPTHWMPLPEPPDEET